MLSSCGLCNVIAYPKGGAMMSDVQMISVLIAFVVIINCLKGDIFISDIELKGSKESFKFKIRTKQKNGSPRKKNRS